MKTNGDILRERADTMGIPLTSVWKAQEGLKKARTKADKAALASLMLRHGRLTAEARKYLEEVMPSS